MTGRIVLGLGGTVDYELEWDAAAFQRLVDDHGIHLAEVEEDPPSVVADGRDTIIERIEDFKGRLDEIGQAISKGDENQIWSFFNQAREQRQAMEIHKRGGVDSSFDLYVDVPDEEDVILRILELLRGTSLVNIHINEENREDVHGILQISFKNAQDLKRAEQVITENTNYTVVIK